MQILMGKKAMKECDRRTIEEYGIPSLVLMERAALAVADEAVQMLGGKRPEGKGPVLAVCGNGNNGADGVAAARILFLRGYDAAILLADEDAQRSRELSVQLAIAEKLGIPIDTAKDYIPGRCSLILDALFGIGLSRPVEGKYRELIDMINGQTDAGILAVDIPSGLSADTGKALGAAVKAHVTVTFGRKKLGQVLFPGRELCGRLEVAEAGFVWEDGTSQKDGEMLREVREQKEGNALWTGYSHEKSDLSRIPKRKADSHKGVYGKVLIMAGSENMAGAAYFSALAAYRCGAGLVKIFTEQSNRIILQEKLPEAILSAYCGEDAKNRPDFFRESVRKETEWADVIVLGPGIGKGIAARLMTETVLSDAYVPLILDADAINLAAEFPALCGYFTENVILTPHVKEMARLMGKTTEEIKDNPVAAARELSARCGVTCVLKDAATVTARKDGSVWLNESGSPAMAKGGSGDVLTGVIAGLIAMGMEEGEAASLGVYIHGLAGEAADRRFGVHSMLAGELADCLSEVIHDVD